MITIGLVILLLIVGAVIGALTVLAVQALIDRYAFVFDDKAGHW